MAILKDDRMATLKRFLGKVPPDKVKEVCIDMKDRLRKVAEEVFPLSRVVLDPFHVIADSGGRMDEARKIEQDAYQKSKVHLPKKYSWWAGRGSPQRRNRGWIRFWRSIPILNHFDNYTTNGFTEGAVPRSRC